jgi:hypothetical protein
MSLRSKPLLRCRSGEADVLRAGSASRQTTQARVPVPHFLDALGQTHNYFTSRAGAVIANQAGTRFRVVQRLGAMQKNPLENAGKPRYSRLK